MNITFRPHHFLCALCFQGSGYSAAFITNFKNIMQILNSSAGDETPITVTTEADVICQPCPNRIEKTCVTQEKIAALDHAHASILSIENNDVITWGDAKKLIASKVTLNSFHQICSSCSWKELNICESVLKDLLIE